MVECQALLDFLVFAPAYADLAEKLAAAVALHATPVGGGTVAGTERIPIHERAEAAVIAWMRHQTAVYDEMKIPRTKRKRRQTRRLPAEVSRRLTIVTPRSRFVFPLHLPLPFTRLESSELLVPLRERWHGLVLRCLHEGHRQIRTLHGFHVVRPRAVGVLHGTTPKDRTADHGDLLFSSRHAFDPAFLALA